MSSLSNTNYSARSMNGLINVNANTGTFTDLEVNNLVVNQSGTAPTMPTSDNSTHIATTAFVQGHTSGAYVTLATNQSISGQKTFTAGNTIVTGNLVCNKFLSDNSGADINIGTNLFTGDIFLGNPTGTAGQNTALNWGTTSNSGQLTFRGGSFTLSSTGNYTQQSAGSLTTSIDTNKTTGAFNMLTGTTWSGNCNIGTGVGATGNINIGGATTKTYMSGNVYVSNYLVSSSTTTNNVRLDDGTINHFMNFNAQNMTFEATQSVAFLANTGYLTFGSPANTYFTNSSGTGKIVQIQDTNFTPLSFEVGTGYNFIRSFAPLTLLTSGTNDAVYSAGGNVTIGGTNTLMSSPTIFNNTATFNVSLPTSSLTPSASNQLTTKAYVDGAISGGLTGYVDIAGTQTITGAKTFQNIAINQLSGNVDLSFNSNTQRFRIRRPTNSLDFNVSTNVSINTTSTTGSLAITAGVAPNIAGLTIYPTGGLGEGAEIDMQAVSFFAGNVWIDSNAGLKSFSSNNIKYYNPISYSYNPTSITWGTPSANTINGWTNAPTNTGDTYTGTASDNTTPANVGQIVLPDPGIWYLQVSALITLNTGSDTITDRMIVVSDVGTTDDTPCTVGFKYRDPIDDGAGSSGNRQQISFSGVYHHVSASGSKTLYINAVVITSGTRTITVSGNYKYTRIG